MPTESQPLHAKAATTNGPWYNFFSNVWSGVPSAPHSTISVGSSTFAYQAPQGGTVYVSGGSVTQIQITRDGQNFFVTGVTSGPVTVSKGDAVIVSYSA